MSSICKSFFPMHKDLHYAGLRSRPMCSVPLSLQVSSEYEGLEASVDGDQNLELTDPSVLFDLYLNTCPNQGSRTICTKEAILISMSSQRQKIAAAANGS
ncbi:hypothetical protein J4Q44_G00237780 [Coregonus suidteri]|uniref:Uncharacterized protein n=1 Tax=Coregonus suidteri TaxID=861788 RepID=A0AAN8QP13_9TELE